MWSTMWSTSRPDNPSGTLSSPGPPRLSPFPTVEPVDGQCLLPNVNTTRLMGTLPSHCPRASLFPVAQDEITAIRAVNTELREKLGADAELDLRTVVG